MSFRITLKAPAESWSEASQAITFTRLRTACQSHREQKAFTFRMIASS
jgi:hypothetical protein